MQRVRNRSGTIIAVIVKRAVTAAPDVRLAAQCIRRPDRVLHILRRPRRRVSDAVAQDGPLPLDRRSISSPFDLWVRVFVILLVILILIVIVCQFSPRPRWRDPPYRLIRDPNWVPGASLLLLFVLIGSLRASHHRSDRCGRNRSQNARRFLNDRCSHGVNRRVNQRERL